MSAQKAFLGAFKMPSSMVDKMSVFAPRAVTQADLRNLPGAIRDKARLVDGCFYLCAPGNAAGGSSSAGEPAIGDTRISFHIVPNTTVSVIARQSGGALEPYVAKTGQTIALLSMGSQSAQSMFQNEISSNEHLTWLLRGGGFLAMFIGLLLAFRPLSVVADVVPFIGGIVGFGTGLLAFTLAISLSLITIAIGWIAYRPVVGIGLLAVAAFVLVLGVMRGRGKRKQAA